MYTYNMLWIVVWLNLILYIFRDDLNCLEYISLCIKESLRLYPPVCIVGRELSQDVKFDGHVMPKGVSALYMC